MAKPDKAAIIEEEAPRMVMFSENDLDKMTQLGVASAIERMAEEAELSDIMQLPMKYSIPARDALLKKGARFFFNLSEKGKDARAERRKKGGGKSLGLRLKTSQNRITASGDSKFFVDATDAIFMYNRYVAPTPGHGLGSAHGLLTYVGREKLETEDFE